jgi:DNA-binding IclR family transcriptional regulator
VTSLPALRASLEAIRRAGFCLTTDELVPGASGIAAPVFDRYGRVAGACAIGGPTERVGPRTRVLAIEVMATARTLSAGLGHRPHDGKEARVRTR